MSGTTGIEWTDRTWNPVTGCTKVSPGCANCYIERTPPFRISGRKFVKGHIPLQFHEDRLLEPLFWRKPSRVFVNSMSDLFHEDVPDAFIDKVFAVMALASQHTYQILTKRPARMYGYFDGDIECMFERWADAALTIQPLGDGENATEEAASRYEEVASLDWPLPDVWLGVSVENQRFADERIPLLLQTPAAVRFISAEPLLAPVDASIYMASGYDDLPHDDILNWVIVGGESGPNARPMKADWARSIRDQCQAAAIPFFFKQWGGRTPKSGGRLLDGRTWDEYPA